MSIPSFASASKPLRVGWRSAKKHRCDFAEVAYARQLALFAGRACERVSVRVAAGSLRRSLRDRQQQTARIAKQRKPLGHRSMKEEQVKMQLRDQKGEVFLLEIKGPVVRAFKLESNN